ncbi:hypothetical protein EYC84_001928 [Monilinia fructicola]|uniref:Uncharacterized protein n=1 Tax=Monilinia fructicola TaxID=38448 RepID=A0A5M9JV45_MONFR|nr:hypothetical protein EYC84_001928 [Monilinia fructicola]
MVWHTASVAPPSNSFAMVCLVVGTWETSHTHMGGLGTGLDWTGLDWTGVDIHCSWQFRGDDEGWCRRSSVGVEWLLFALSPLSPQGAYGVG